MKPEGLPVQHRVRKRAAFVAAYEHGSKGVGKHVVLFARAVDAGRCRLGVTATRKIGNSVRRNRARRLVREAFRRQRQQLPTGFDYIVVARHSIFQSDARQLGPELLELARRATA